MKRNIMDRLSHLPESVLIQILSLLPDKKAIVRSSILSKRWRFLWKSVPQSLRFHWFPGEDISDFVSSIYRELYYAKLFKKTQKFIVHFRYSYHYGNDVDIWVQFATQANVEHFELRFSCCSDYELPQYVYQNLSFTNLVLINCPLKPSGSISWSNLISLSIGDLKLTDGVMEKILSGCPNLECLELDTFCGISRLEISSEHMRKLIIRNCFQDLEIVAPYIHNLQILESCDATRFWLRNVASLVTAVLHFEPELWYCDKEDKLERIYSCFKELLHSVAHVENLELGPCCIELLSLLELKGWPSPPSSRKFLKLNTALKRLDFPGLCSLLQSSMDLETIVIDWKKNYEPRKFVSKFKNENEDNKRFQTHNCNCALLHLKTIKIIHFPGALTENKFVFPLVQYLLKNAIVLEKLIIAARFEGIGVSQDYVEMEQEFLSFPRSSLHASVVFSNK